MTIPFDCDLRIGVYVVVGIPTNLQCFLLYWYWYWFWFVHILNEISKNILIKDAVEAPCLPCCVKYESFYLIDMLKKSL